MIDLEKYTFEKLLPPISEENRGCLKTFWETVFQTTYDRQMNILAGNESHDIEDYFYLAKTGSEIAATVHLTCCKHQSGLAGLGEVATSPECRGAGLASELCRKALDDFQSSGGKALFLGTGNPVAAKLYQKLGWVNLPGSQVMIHLPSGQTPEVFFGDHYSMLRDSSASYRIRPLNPGDRVAIIPLILVEHPWITLDLNANLFSIRFFIQKSCMGLYPRYEQIIEKSGTVWIWEHEASRLPIGILSVQPLSDGRVCIDGFVHPLASEQLIPFYRQVLDEVHQKGFDSAVIPVCQGDRLKETALTSLKLVLGESCDFTDPEGNVGRYQEMIYRF